MQRIFNNYLLNKKIKIYINILDLGLVVYCDNSFFVLKIPSTFFYKSTQDVFNILFLYKYDYVSFLRHFFNFYNRIFSLYFFRLKLKGLGYRLIEISKFLIKIFLNRSNFFYLHLPTSVFFKYRSRRLFFVSINYNNLRMFIVHILLLKNYLAYRMTGIFFPRQILLMKPGKNKFR
jgi:hypothetical protein